MPCGLRTPTLRPDPQAEEISLLIRRQKSARAAIRLELFLPPQLKPTRIPDPLDRQEVPASPGRGGGGPPTALHTWPQPLSRSGGAWRPSWRRKWTAGTSCADCHSAVAATPPSPIKFWFSKACWSLCSPSRPRGGKGSQSEASPTKQKDASEGVSGQQEPRTPLTSQTQSCPPAGAGTRAWLSSSHSSMAERGQAASGDAQPMLPGCRPPHRGSERK